MGKRWIKLDKVSSTNSYTSNLLRQENHRDSFVVTADYQEAGRGQGDHCWHSRFGENLLMSLLLFPAFLSASSQFRLSMVASLAITDTLDSLGITTSIKWPNDILTKKGKIAGILIEHALTGKSISHSIIGVGLNLNQVKFPDFPTPATSVMLEKALQTDPEEVAKNLVHKLEMRYDILENRGSQTIEHDYLERLHLINRPATFHSKGESFKGKIRGVSEFGELQVEKGDQLMTFCYGEVGIVG